LINIQTNPDKRAQTQLVSIGLPVYNGATKVSAAIEGLLAQTYRNIELIISDNCSTDETQKICGEFAVRDKRIKYFRQAENIGAGRNFRFVLEQAQGKYFLWNAGDDTRSPDYVAVNVAFLEAHPDYCASTSRARDEGGRFNPRWMGDRALTQTRAEDRILTYFKGWHRNSIFYSMYRREVLVDNPVLYGPEHLGQDWTMIIQLAKSGKFQRLEQGELVLGTGGISKGIRHLRSVRKQRIEYFFPHWELCMYLKEISKDFSLRGRIILFIRAVTLNIRANLMRLIHVFER
jgi:glycosyltransferase involved in cell wall biosynthesis